MSPVSRKALLIRTFKNNKTSAVGLMMSILIVILALIAAGTSL